MYVILNFRSKLPHLNYLLIWKYTDTPYKVNPGPLYTADVCLSQTSLATSVFFTPLFFSLVPYPSYCLLYLILFFLFSSLQFVEHCRPLTEDCPEVLTFLQTKHSKACPDFLSSVELRNTLGRCLTRAQANRSKTFVYINELCTVLKQHAIKKRQTLFKVDPGPSTSTSSDLQSTSVTLKSKSKSKGNLDEEEEGVQPAADEEQPSTSGQQENREADREEERKAKRASRKQVSVD